MIKDPPNLGRVLSQAGTFTVEWINWFASVYRICRANVETGTTANRPTRNLWIGRRYFDTTINQPIYITQITPAVVWRDAAGAIV